MHFGLSEPQRAIYDKAREFGATLRGDNERLIADDQAGVFDRDAWRQAAKYGLLGLNVPTSSGGHGKSNLDTALALEGFGEGCCDTGLVFAVSSQLVSVIDCLVRFGNSRQTSELLARTVAGDAIGCYAITEPGAGSVQTVSRLKRRPRSKLTRGA